MEIKNKNGIKILFHRQKLSKLKYPYLDINEFIQYQYIEKKKIIQEVNIIYLNKYMKLMMLTS